MYRYRAKVLACKWSSEKIEEQKIEMSLGAFFMILILILNS